MKQKHADSPSAFLAAAMAVTGAAMLLCPLIGQNAEMNRSAAEYDDLRVQLKSEEPAQATDAPENRSTLRQMFDAAGFPSTTQVPLELPEQDENPPEINIGTGADLAACLAQNDDFIAWIRIPGTNVDYPVVWTDDAEHYLHHTFTGKQAAISPFMGIISNPPARRCSRRSCGTRMRISMPDTKPCCSIRCTKADHTAFLPC